MDSYFGIWIPPVLFYTILLIFTVLILVSISFTIFHKISPGNLSEELLTRTKSWWFIGVGVSIIIISPAWLGTIIFGYISFVALRELMSIAGFRASDRIALFLAYFSVPIQYLLAYYNYYELFLYFIPLIMFIIIPFVLVINGNIFHISRSMTHIPSILILTVYMFSHIILLYHIDIKNSNVGVGGLIIYIILLTEFNDIFQFVWGKIFGKKKILPSISPNKTWVGFIGGVITTACLAYVINFLTPLNKINSAIIGIFISVTGFIGDSLISAIKRELGIKDTDDLIPGHGGALDRLDSLFLTVPVFYHLLLFFIKLQ